ncbi:hypothetical protein [Paenibacillus ginsengihumi]|uniref:hypothetical protein n=1 Tax=Paenibacillus ginsengihumi TaxID=431596 RepID=UPI00036F3DE0|nr:hypothetical protein [Paenibacillus ginsengihumi]
MAILKESEHYERIQALHEKLWEQLQEVGEKEAEALLQKCLRQIDDDERISYLGRVKSFVKTRGFLVSVIVGVAIVPLTTGFILWASLLLE